MWLDLSRYTGIRLEEQRGDTKFRSVRLTAGLRAEIIHRDFLNSGCKAPKTFYEKLLNIVHLHYHSSLHAAIPRVGCRLGRLRCNTRELVGSDKTIYIG